MEQDTRQCIKIECLFLCEVKLIQVIGPNLHKGMFPAKQIFKARYAGILHWKSIESLKPDMLGFCTGSQ